LLNVMNLLHYGLVHNLYFMPTRNPAFFYTLVKALSELFG
jgi:hypothetical protein